jgi:hypothetical protein
MGGAVGDSGILDALMDPVSDAMAGVENPQSGARLKGKFMMGADGSKEYQLATAEVLPAPQSSDQHTYPGLAVHAVWYDSLLMADCSFNQATDGKVRCLPGHAPVPGVEGAAVFYKDFQCTQPVIAVQQPPAGCPSPPVPAYVLQPLVQLDTCIFLSTAPTPIGVVQVGAQIAAPPAVYRINYIYSNYTTSCQPAGQGGATWYAGTVVPPSSFVEGVAGIDP